MTATTPSGEPKIVRECSYPLTARSAADVVVTEMAVFRLVNGSLCLTELLGDATLKEVEAVTEPSFMTELEV
jgi:acyl CoA:acetate/3-ketoacid CoA transferase beta subunit